ncbi:MAG: hypothetical protein RIT28_3338 [Pseudomonadota bacterium]
MGMEPRRSRSAWVMPRQSTLTEALAQALSALLRLMWGEDKVRATLWHFEHKRGS